MLMNFIHTKFTMIKEGDSSTSAGFHAGILYPGPIII